MGIFDRNKKIRALLRFPHRTGIIDFDAIIEKDTIKQHLSRIPKVEVASTFKEKLLCSLVGGEGWPHMRSLGMVPTPNAAPSSSNAAPFSLESIPQELLQTLVDKRSICLKKQLTKLGSMCLKKHGLKHEMKLLLLCKISLKLLLAAKQMLIRIGHLWEEKKMQVHRFPMHRVYTSQMSLHVDFEGCLTRSFYATR